MRNKQVPSGQGASESVGTAVVLHLPKNDAMSSNSVIVAKISFVDPDYTTMR